MRKRIAFFSGPAWEKWDAHSPLTQGIGGSETCLVYLSRELAQLGYDVSLFIDTPERSEREGVRYIPYSDFPSMREEQYDFFIHFRNTKALPLAPRTHCQIGFAQDITLSTSADTGPRLDGKLDYLFCLSEMHRRHLSQHHSFPLERILMTANAVDPVRYETKKDKVHNQIFYSSCPSRDLDLLLEASIEIAKRVPDFQLVVAYGLQTWEGMLRQGRGDYRKYFFTLDMMKHFPWVKFLGRVNQAELAQVQLSSRGWFYPTRFPETFCITAAEAGFARCPILCSDSFGLATTVKDGGVVVVGDPARPDLKERYIKEAVRLLTDDAHWQLWSDRAYERMKRFTWAAVARQWHQFFESGRWEEIQ